MFIDPVLTASASIVGLGLADSLNPATIATMVLFLCMSRGRLNGAIFIVVTFATYLLAGMGLLLGWSSLVEALWSRVTPVMKAYGLILLGVGLLIGAAWPFLRGPKPKEGAAPKPVAGSVLAIVIVSIGATLSDIPTALPYFAAIAVLETGQLGQVGRATLLVVYNLLYVAPLIALLIVRIRGGATVETTFARIQNGIDWTLRYIMPPLCAVLGGVCVWVGWAMLGGG